MQTLQIKDKTKEEFEKERFQMIGKKRTNLSQDDFLKLLLIKWKKN